MVVHLAMEYGGEKFLNDLIEERNKDSQDPSPAAIILKVALNMAALGMRPPITMEELGETYQRGTELFSMCTDEDPKGRPAAAHPVEAPEMDVLWSPHTHDYWSLRVSAELQHDRPSSLHLVTQPSIPVAVSTRRMLKTMSPDNGVYMAGDCFLGFPKLMKLRKLPETVKMAKPLYVSLDSYDNDG
ncbi:hypothetical protein JEQ12_010818 [Ovis aries]|uniref:Uncharacterized protein n=1 Tax=Ovis aries TaxID=9940 RepID=A0A836CTU3_SHEEP|nr:hypothetical protein JEQ12_010818 [Ovis aries]